MSTDRLTGHIRRSYGDRTADNALIHGDNLEILRVLSPKLLGSVRCIYVDPPYNNQESYVHYKDALPHEDWLAETAPRIEQLWPLLRDDGSLWISIDDREAHYLKVALDERFGRDAFAATIVWQHRTTRENRRAFSYNHEYILVYAKNPRIFRDTRNRLALTPAVLNRYRNPDDDPRGPWQSVSLNVQAGHGTKTQFYKLRTPNGRRLLPPQGRCWVFTKARMQEEIRAHNIWFGKDGKCVPRLKRFLVHDNRGGLTPETLWCAEDVGTTYLAKKHLIAMFPRRRQFDTPKPESLIARILSIATDSGDLVMDAYLGSGTTAAVAHKMKRRYIGIERERSAIDLAEARLRLVIAGEANGISTRFNWHGGGGFELYRLPS